MDQQEATTLALHTSTLVEKLPNEELEDLVEVLSGVPSLNTRLALLATLVHYTITIERASEETFQNMLKSLLLVVPVGKDAHKELATAEALEA